MGTASAVFVSANAVYDARWQIPRLQFTFMVCKNGVANQLTDGIKFINLSFVFVSGDDVYVGSNEYNNNTDKMLVGKFGKII